MLVGQDQSTLVNVTELTRMRRGKKIWEWVVASHRQKQDMAGQVGAFMAMTSRTEDQFCNWTAHFLAGKSMQTTVVSEATNWRDKVLTSWSFAINSQSRTPIASSNHIQSERLRICKHENHRSEMLFASIHLAPSQLECKREFKASTTRYVRAGSWCHFQVFCLLQLDSNSWFVTWQSWIKHRLVLQLFFTNLSRPVSVLWHNILLIWLLFGKRAQRTAILGKS